MPWHNDPKHPFAGIAEKLKRADENIVNLSAEIVLFFQESKYPVIPNPDDQGWQEAVNYHKHLHVPRRFSVLAGEIAHHLRSSLDHLIWIFSNDTARQLHANALEFPVLCAAPGKNELARFDRQIQGVDKPSVRKLITDLQPYQRGADALDDPLCIIHDMDRFDKHRELVIVTTSAHLTFPTMPPELATQLLAYKEGKALSPDDVRALQRAVKHKAKVSPDVAFAKFGKGETQPVVPSLTQLVQALREVVSRFAIEL